MFLQFKLFIFREQLYISVYLYYFITGSPQLQSECRQISVYGFLTDTAEWEACTFTGTRRWLQKTERPFPGYCRAPGDGHCLPMLCNCDILEKIWIKSKYKEIMDKKAELEKIIEQAKNYTEYDEQHSHSYSKHHHPKMAKNAIEKSSYKREKKKHA